MKIPKRVWISLIIAGLILSACGSASTPMPATSTPVVQKAPTQTSVPISTSTPTRVPTNTPRPTLAPTSTPYAGPLYNGKQMDKACPNNAATMVLDPYIGNIVVACPKVEFPQESTYSFTAQFEKGETELGEHTIALEGIGDFSTFSAFITFQVHLPAGDYKQLGYADDYANFTLVDNTGDRVYNYEVDSLEDFDNEFRLDKDFDGWMVIEFLDNGGGAYITTTFGPHPELITTY